MDMIASYKFNTENLVPNSYRVDAEATDGSGRKGFVFQEAYKWSEISGVMVPRQVTAERLSSRKVGDTRIRGVLYKDVRFHWFSVNEKLAEEQFSNKNLVSPAEMMRLTNPKESGADSLASGVKAKENSETK